MPLQRAQELGSERGPFWSFGQLLVGCCFLGGGGAPFLRLLFPLDLFFFFLSLFFSLFLSLSRHHALPNLFQTSPDSTGRLSLSSFLLERR